MKSNRAAVNHLPRRAAAAAEGDGHGDDVSSDGDQNYVRLCLINHYQNASFITYPACYDVVAPERRVRYFEIISAFFDVRLKKIYFSACNSLPEIVPKLLRRLIAAYEYFPQHVRCR